MQTFDTAVHEVLQLATFCSQQGWLPATSGNLSVLVSDDPLKIAITRSGADKQRLIAEDILLINQDMHVENSQFKPSAETRVHVELYQKFNCGSILHVHTLYNNLLSTLDFQQSEVRIAGHELLKALGHWEKDAQIAIPIVPNYADLDQLGSAVAEVATADVPAVFVHAHGVYVWGETPDDARKNLEAVEFLCAYLYHLRVAQART